MIMEIVLVFFFSFNKWFIYGNIVFYIYMSYGDMKYMLYGLVIVCKILKIAMILEIDINRNSNNYEASVK